MNSHVSIFGAREKGGALVERRSLVPVVVWTVVSFTSALLMLLIMLAPLAAATGRTGLSSSIYQGFSYFCHQLSDRSFHLAGQKFAVCSRCTGLYAGFALAALGYPLIRSLRSTETCSRLWLILAALPLAVDFSLGYFNLGHNTHASRFVSGAILSAVAVFFIIPGLVEISTRSFARQR